VNFKVETDKFTRNINLLTQEFYKAGQTGDRELYKNTAQELQRIYPQVIELYGEANAKAIYNEIDSKSTISYLSGLMESNPEEVVSILSEKDSQAAFLIGDNQKANHLKNTAETFAKERKKHKIKQDVANGIITTNSLAEKVLNGNITYDDIEASKILIQDKKDIESIYKLIGIKADGTPYVTKEQEKIKIAENKILVYQNLSERVLDTQIAKPGNQSMEDLKQLESDLLKAVAEGSITKAEWKELSEPIKQTMVQVMGTTTDKEQENVYDEGEVVNGMTNFRENVKKALERNGLPTDIKYYDKNGKMTEEYKKLSPAVKKRIAEINLLYNEKLTDALKEVTYNYALNNNLQYIDPWTMLSLMSGKDQQETFRKANFLIEKSIATQRGIKDVDKMSPQEVLQVNYTYDIQQNQNYVIDSMNKDPILKNTTHSILTDPDLIEAQRKATENEDDLGLEFDLDFN
jgi:hypothetical protein